MQGPNHCAERIRSGLGEGFGGNQDLFRMARSEIFARRRAPARAVGDGHRVPRFADAVAINQARAERAGHLRGGQHDKAHILFGIDATLLQPVAHEEVVGATS